MAKYQYGYYGLPVRVAPTRQAIVPGVTDAKRQAEFQAACASAAHHRLILCRYRIHEAGYRVLAPIVAHLGWDTAIATMPADMERDMLSELLLMIYKHGQTLHLMTEIIFGLFVLLCDTAALGQTRIGRQLVSLGGDHAMRAAIVGQSFGERTVYFLLAIAIRDRLVAGEFIRVADMGLRLTHAKRAQLAVRLGQT